MKLKKYNYLAILLFITFFAFTNKNQNEKPIQPPNFIVFIADDAANDCGLYGNEVIKTPFIVRWPGVTKKGRTAALINSIDIAPTFCELSGAEQSKTFQGVSFAPILKNYSAKTRDYIVGEHNWHDHQAHERAIRNEEFLYIRNAFPELNAFPPADAVRSLTYQEIIQFKNEGKLNNLQLNCFVKPRSSEELYDVVNDPFQLTNLAYNADNQV